MLKKIVPALLAVLLAGSFAGCQSKPNTSSSVSSTISSAASDAKENASASPEASKDASASSKAEASAKPESSAAPEKTEAADGLGAFREALHGVYGDKYYPDTKLTEDEIREELGLDDTLYEEVYVENTAEKAHPDTFIAVKAKAGKVDEVKEKLTAYKQRLLSDNAFAANTDKIDAAEIYSEGDYVFFVLLGDIDDSTSSEGFAEAFGKEIQRGIDAIKEALGAM